MPRLAKLVNGPISFSSSSSLGMHKSPSTSSNGSRVAVPEEVIVVENSTDEEDEETKALNPLPIV